MKEHPIIFSGPMVKALLDGRKTQTRRLATSPLRRVEPGDKLWVRENWQALSPGDYLPTKQQLGADVRYAATDRLADADKDVRGYSWRPSIHMPRWASRLTLAVTNVWQESLRSICSEHAIAEGIESRGSEWVDYMDPVRSCRTPGDSYLSLWASLHGTESVWDNPRVVALEFTVERA